MPDSRLPARCAFTFSLLVTATAIADEVVPVPDAGFESGGVGWSGGRIVQDESVAAPEGRACIEMVAGEFASASIGRILNPGETYRLRAWTRRSNPPGTSAFGVGSIRLSSMVGGKTTIELGTTALTVDPPRLGGAAATVASDDGVNVWFDGGYPMHFGDIPLYQSTSADPLVDPWLEAERDGYDFDNALGPLRTSNGFRAIYDCFYDDAGPPYESIIGFRRPTGSAPDYTWDDEYEVVLEHTPTEFPWVIDPHLFEDPDTERVWMSWGGHVIHVTEIDPLTGRILGDPADPEIDTHPAGTHVPILKWPESIALGGDPAQPPGWCGDAYSSCYMEGPALFKHGGWWYAFASYGNLGSDYTIRMARSASPTGPYLDKDGVNGTTFDRTLDRYGASMLLAAEGDQAVPGHPAVWKDGDRLLLGYDQRPDPLLDVDRMAIRELHVVDGWPTIWSPIELEIRVDDHPDAVGGELKIELGGVGDPGSVVLFDRIELERIETPCPSDLDGDRRIDGADLARLLIGWGATGPGDINGDGLVDAADLGVLFIDWGSCP